MTVRILTDSTCDLPPAVIAEHRIAGVPIRMQGEFAPVIGAHVGHSAVGLVRTQAPPRA